jgi:hypothetical protein
MKKDVYARFAAGIAALLIGFPAGAANVDINIDIPGAYAPPPPVFVQPRPVIVQSQPIYVEREDGYQDCKKGKCKFKKHKKEKHHKHDDHDGRHGHGRD